jgi:hypothetical protein
MNIGELKIANVTIVDGYKAGYSQGETDGYSKGEADGYIKGEAESYPKGYEDGYEKGEIEGVEVGREAERSEFWDKLTQNNTRIKYNYPFVEWTDEMYKPPYTLKPHSANQMYCRTRMVEGVYNNPPDLSQCRFADQMFFDNTTITKIPLLDLHYLYNTPVQMLSGPIQWIEGVILNDAATLGGMFNFATLKHVIFLFEAKKNITLAKCVDLDKESIDSVMDSLSTTTEGLSVTFSIKAVNKAYETSEGANDGSTSEEWKSKVEAKPNWTIAYA